ncbi:hypothetical protein HY357_04200 [Candidatus Roizmanbacteria bacterium]|nr:hypothetical protein [Candidatus Roizmanbacteria bacterium]
MDTKAKILDIAMNLNRIGNWAADDFEKKQKRISLFLNQTAQYIEAVDSEKLSKQFQKTFLKFLAEYKKLEAANPSKSNSIYWAETMMTWGNILTHRSKLL